MTKLARLESYLKAGNEITAKQITSMFKLRNPSAAIHALRSNGVNVNTKKTTLSTGVKTSKYKVNAAAK